ncbi:MAG: TIGR00730 family Rossman fold protein [Proteobacteria bacterium]|nr:TIGR00730 family Rossman fold protein [Pseudomonadota bacterium]
MPRPHSRSHAPASPDFGRDAPSPETTPPGELTSRALEARIRASDSQRRADQDLELLARPDLRSIRLALEYLKPELAFSDHGVERTVVVFGSTRLLAPEQARERLAQARAAAGVRADGPQVTRARADLARSRYYEVGRELGQLVGRHGRGVGDNRLVVVTGGGPGGMEAANRGAHDVGAASVGLNITLPLEQEANPYITPELSFQFRYFALRKLHFMLRARALVALPGGYGTLDELFETLCLVQTGKRAPLPVILVGEGFWRRAVDFEFLVEEGMIDARHLDLFEFAETAPEAWERILRWYADRERSIFDGASDDPPRADTP